MKKVIYLTFLLLAVLLAGCSNEFEKEKLAEAGEFFETKNYDQAIEAYEQVLEKNKKNEKAYLGLSNVYVAQEKNDRAIAILKEGIEVVKQKQKRDLLLELGHRYVDAEDYAMAEEIWFSILSNESDDIETYNALFSMYRSQDEKGKAFDLMEAAMGVNEKNARIYAMVANEFLEYEELDRAIAAIQTGLDIDHNEMALYSALTTAHRSGGYEDMAEDGEERIFEDSQKSSGYMMAFYGHYIDGQYEKALKAVKPILKKIENESLLVRVALCNQLSGEESVANKIMKDFDLGSIKNVTAYTDILYYYHTIGDTEKAVSVGNEILKNYRDEKIYWVLYDFTKDEKYLKELGLLKWSHDLKKGDSLEVAGISDSGDVTVGTVMTTGEFWDEDYSETTFMEGLDSNGKSKWTHEKDVYGVIQTFENPKGGQTYYQELLYEHIVQPLNALDENGKEVWHIDEAITQPAFSSDGTIYIGVLEGEKGYLQAIDMKGKEKWSIPVDIPQNPVVDGDGTIYTSSYSG